MKTRISLKYLWMIVACCLYFTFFYNNAHNYLFIPRSNLMHCLKIVSMILKLCYNHILTLCFWGSVLQWSTIKTKYPNFTFFQHFYIPTMVNHVVKDDQKLVSVFNHGIKDLKRHVRIISSHCSFWKNSLQWSTIVFFF